ncbi:MAG: hypothetical protein BZ136_07625 [Methanosphaera sp. rholeuAM74]|nr:MAG: hypothetical protein BZ136_07625 [Methanosphaera sp. rholeuAM74]
MRSDVGIIISVLLVALIAIMAVGGYLVYEDLQKENDDLKHQLQDVKNELEDTKENLTKEEDSITETSKSSSSSSSSSGGKVTYEEAGVNKASGYIKTCKYPGCGARYNSSLSHCPKCGQKNIYV